MSAGNSSVSILALLDVTVAFDTVDHKIPLNRLENWFGPKGTDLNWFNTYSISLAKDISLASATMSLERTFFVLYYSACICYPLVKLLVIMVRIIIVMLMTLLYLSVVPDNPDALNPIINCLYSMEQLMSNSFLK